MFRRLILILIISFLFVSSVFSQFVVVSSYPTNGQAALPVDPDSVLFRFSFSKPVDLNRTWPRGNIPIGPLNFLDFSPIDSIQFGQFYFSPDSISWFAKLRPGTDYCAILLGAYATDGELLSKPYVINFTTNSTVGTRTVSGRIAPPPSPRISSLAGFSNFDLKNLKLKLSDEFGGKEIDLNLLKKMTAPSLAFKNLSLLLEPSKTLSVDPNVGVIALVKGNPLAGEYAEIRYAANINSDSSFNIGYVRDGQYYLFAIFDTQRDGFFDFSGDLLMFYDADGDGQPDPVNVSGSDVTGLVVSGSLQARPFTIREKLDTVKAVAQSYASDAVLRQIETYEGVEIPVDTLDGKVYGARYGFHSDSKGSFAIEVNAWGDIRLGEDLQLLGTVNLPDTFVDSDVAFDSAEANGGYDFRSGGGDSVGIFYSLRNYDIFELPPDTTNPYWQIVYFRSFDDMLIFYLDPSDGHLVKKIKIGIVTAKENFNEVNSIALNYASDSKLMYVLGLENTAIVDGKCFWWNYGYESPSRGRFSIGVWLGIPSEPDTTWWLSNPITRRLDFENYKDSDALSSVAEANGGSAFRSIYQTLSIVYVYVQSPVDTSKIYFHSVYTGYDTTDTTTKNFIALIDPVTGAFVGGFVKVEKDVAAGIPSNFILYQNYPNPFNPTTTITYDLPVRGDVKLTVYNILGQEVAVLVNEVQEPGRYNVKFDASGLPSGVYFYKLESGNLLQVRKMILVK